MKKFIKSLDKLDIFLLTACFTIIVVLGWLIYADGHNKWMCAPKCLPHSVATQINTGKSCICDLTREIK